MTAIFSFRTKCSAAIEIAYCLSHEDCAINHVPLDNLPGIAGSFFWQQRNPRFENRGFLHMGRLFQLFMEHKNMNCQEKDQRDGDAAM